MLGTRRWYGWALWDTKDTHKRTNRRTNDDTTWLDFWTRLLDSSWDEGGTSDCSSGFRSVRTPTVQCSLLSDDEGSECRETEWARGRSMKMGMADHGGGHRTRGIEWGRTDADKGCPFITPQNQRIECWWSCLRKGWAQIWMNLFDDLIFFNSFEPTDNVQIVVAKFCFMHIIRHEINDFIDYWKSHTDWEGRWQVDAWEEFLTRFIICPTSTDFQISCAMLMMLRLWRCFRMRLFPSPLLHRKFVHFAFSYMQLIAGGYRNTAYPLFPCLLVWSI